MVVEEDRRVAKDELGLPNVEVEGMTRAGRAYTIGRFHSMKCAQNAAGTRDWEWKLCTKVIAHTVGEKGVALQLDTDTMSRLLSIRKGTDDSFMSLEEFLDLAPKSNGGTDWLGMTPMTAVQLGKLWGKGGFPKGTTLDGLTRACPDPGTRVARVLWLCYQRTQSAKTIAGRVAQRKKDAMLK